jgi:cell division initiation protein
MDLTPDALRGMEFRRKGRGYDVDDVDEFRHTVEVWVGEMQARLREATGKLEEAETRAREAEDRARTSTESDETIQRTLLLAQRTADAAVKEAEETAGRKVAEAEAEADRLVTEARTHRERAISEAEAEVREAIDAKRAELLDELSTLERSRDALSGDVALLEAHIEAQRNRLREVQAALTQVIDHPDALGDIVSPTLSGLEVPTTSAPVETAAAFAETDTEGEPEPWTAAADEEPAEAEAEVEAAAEMEAEDEPEPLFGTPVEEPGDEAVVADESAWAEPAVDLAPADESTWDAPPPPPPPPPDLEVDPSAWADAPPPPPPPPPDLDAPGAETGSTSGFGGLAGPAVPSLDDVTEDDNPWLAELREEGEGGERSRFGRRR